MFNKITIVGVGLIGGSIGLAARKKKLAAKVVGVCRRESSRRKALKFRAVDEATLNLKKGVEGADLVILALPVAKIVPKARECLKYMRKGAILTDAGSSKEKIVSDMEKPVFKNRANFVGSHPMAGSDKSGAENASADIFKGALTVITKTPKTEKRTLAKVKKFWQNLGCRTIFLSPGEHDRTAALASYLPHAVSYALSLSQNAASSRLAAGSLRDTTRVASSDPGLWKDIFLFSHRPLLRSIDIFSANLGKLKSAIKKKDAALVARILSRAVKTRREIEKWSGLR